MTEGDERLRSEQSCTRYFLKIGRRCPRRDLVIALFRSARYPAIIVEIEAHDDAGYDEDPPSAVVTIPLRKEK